MPPGPDTGEAWHLRLEGVLREIDAGFAPGAVPPELTALRDRVRATLRVNDEAPT